MPQFTQSEMREILDTCMEGILIGTPGSISCQHLADDYLDTFHHPQAAASACIEDQARKDSTNGFVAGLGGFLTRVENEEVQIAGILNEQMRLAAIIALLAEKDLHDPHVQSGIYASLCEGGCAGKNSCQSTDHEAIKDAAAGTLAYAYSNPDFMDFIKAVPIAGGLARIRADYKKTQDVGKRAFTCFM